MSYSGIILSGGKSSRMGQDKALMEFDGTPMIQHTASLLRKFCNEIIIASNNKVHHPFGDHGVKDSFPNSGPIAGIEAGLSVAKNEYCVVLSCDTPFVNSEIIQSLLKIKNADAVVACCNERAHPLIAIYRRNAHKVIQQQLKEASFKMHSLLTKLNTSYVDFPASESDAFRNINTQKEWKESIEK